jgi:hypothetical protein
MPSAMAQLTQRAWSARTRKAMSIVSCSLRPVALGRDGAGVGLTGEGGDLVEGRLEDVGLVVRRLGGEILEALRRGVDAGDALEAHAGVDVFGGQRGEGAVGVRVELDEDVVPDLDAARADELFTSLRPSASSSEGRRLKWISEHGPQGPVSPIIQKLSFLLPLTMWTAGSRPASVKILAQMS